MNFLLDTNLVSEWVKPRPNPGVVAWMADVDEDRTFVSVVTITELRFGVEKMVTGSRKQWLHRWLEDELPPRFDGRLLSIDPAIADECGKLIARSESAGRKMGSMDAFIAATAEVHRLILVTRNVPHFRELVKNVLNPWI
jgi:predicted nucleic acid-binding protein